MPIVECVPNFSEGRNRSVIDQITGAITRVDGASLLDVDPGQATNRTVVTFVGEPEPVLEAAFQAIRTAADLIDMRRHRGEHPRMGATDVCPFVPVAGIGLEDCAALARRLGERVGKELGIPVYLYEYAASRPERKNLADIRSGEYEGLPEKLRDPAWRPDFGPAAFNSRSGATVIGARKFLIAYNVNLNTRDRKLAHDIALDIREAGRAQRDAAGEIVRDARGRAVKSPGRLKATRAVGWYIDEYDRAQVSINLVDFEQTGPHDAFDVVEEEARKRGLRVTGSELVGLIPLEAVLQAGRHYLRKQGKSTGIPERKIVDTAIQSLGLRDIATFDPDDKIIEYRLARGRRRLIDRTVVSFVDEISCDSPAPGGGSAAALCGALSAALSGMVANLTVGRKGQEDAWPAMSELAVRAQARKDWCLEAIDRDTAAFNRVIEAMKGIASTPEEITARAAAVKEAGRGATMVPLEVLKAAGELADLTAEVARSGNPNSLSDAGVAAQAARACAEGAWYNVLINLRTLDADEWSRNVAGEAERALKAVRVRTDAIASDVEARLTT